MLLIYQNMPLFLKNTKICTYMHKISKKENIYPIYAYNKSGYNPYIYIRVPISLTQTIISNYFAKLSN